MSPAVRNFILKFIDSIETIEILLLLRLANSEWKTPEQISQELRSNPTSVLKRLLILKSQGLVAGHPKYSDQFKFDPKENNIDNIVQEFADAYKAMPHKIFEIVYSADRQLKEFADAFIISKTKKEEDDNG